MQPIFMKVNQCKNVINTLRKRIAQIISVHYVTCFATFVFFCTALTIGYIIKKNPETSSRTFLITLTPISSQSSWAAFQSLLNTPSTDTINFHLSLFKYLLKRALERLNANIERPFKRHGKKSTRMNFFRL